MNTLDPQHQAVAGAVAALRAQRHFTRPNPQRQQDYLHDLEALAAEILLCLREADIPDARLLTTYRKLGSGPLASIETAIRITCQNARDHLDRTNP